MLSRHADSLFWMARYVERAENLARFADVNYHNHLEAGPLHQTEANRWEPVLSIAGELQNYRQNVGAVAEDKVLEHLTHGAQNPNSILSCLDRARQNARSIRELISSEMWEELNKFYLFVREVQGTGLMRGGYPYGFFQEVKNRSHLFQGVTDSTLWRDEGWQFIQAGRWLERAYQTTRLLDVKYYILLEGAEAVGGPVDQHQWIGVLKSCSAYEAYRRKYAAQVSPQRVVELLLLAPDFPRSVFFAVQRLEWALKHISGSIGSDLPANQAERLTGDLRGRLAEAGVKDITAFGLHEYLTDVADQIWGIGDAVNAIYFAYS